MRVNASQIRLMVNLFGKEDTMERRDAKTALMAIFPEAFKWEQLQAEILFRRHDFAGGDMVIDVLVTDGPAATLLTVWRPGKDKSIEIPISGYVYKIIGDAFQGTIKVFRCAE